MQFKHAHLLVKCPDGDSHIDFCGYFVTIRDVQPFGRIDVCIGPETVFASEEGSILKFHEFQRKVAEYGHPEYLIMVSGELEFSFSDPGSSRPNFLYQDWPAAHFLLRASFLVLLPHDLLHDSPIPYPQ